MEKNIIKISNRTYTGHYLRTGKSTFAMDFKSNCPTDVLLFCGSQSAEAPIRSTQSLAATAACSEEGHVGALTRWPQKLGEGMAARGGRRISEARPKSIWRSKEEDDVSCSLRWKGLQLMRKCQHLKVIIIERDRLFGALSKSGAARFFGTEPTEMLQLQSTRPGDVLFQGGSSSLSLDKWSYLSHIRSWSPQVHLCRLWVANSTMNTS